MTDLPWLRVETDRACFAVAVRDGVIVGGAPIGARLFGRNAREVCRELKARGAKLSRLEPIPWWERAAEICERVRGERHV